jgi:hypothetical protein
MFQSEKISKIKMCQLCLKLSMINLESFQILSCPGEMRLLKGTCSPISKGVKYSLHGARRFKILPTQAAKESKINNLGTAAMNKEAVHSFGCLVSNWPGWNLQIRDSFEIEVDI